MPAHDLAVTIGALLATIALLFAARPLLRRLNTARGTGGARALQIAGSLALDRTRRLTLVQIHGAHALVLTGGSADTILPWPAHAPAFETALSAIEGQRA